VAPCATTVAVSSPHYPWSFWCFHVVDVWHWTSSCLPFLNPCSKYQSTSSWLWLSTELHVGYGFLPCEFLQGVCHTCVQSLQVDLGTSRLEQMGHSVSAVHWGWSAPPGYPTVHLQPRQAKLRSGEDFKISMSFMSKSVKFWWKCEMQELIFIFIITEKFLTYFRFVYHKSELELCSHSAMHSKALTLLILTFRSLGFLKDFLTSHVLAKPLRPLATDKNQLNFKTECWKYRCMYIECGCNHVQNFRNCSNHNSSGVALNSL
jgi:hypothetical protein